jgi:hypothetical protein
MPPDPKNYLRSLTDLYHRLPETPGRLNRFDYRLAHDLLDRQIPLTVVEAALLLASARRTCRPAGARPLGPIRSLHYFLPVIEEVLQNPLPDSYLAYLRRTVVLRPSA